MKNFSSITYQAEKRIQDAGKRNYLKGILNRTIKYIQDEKEKNPQKNIDEIVLDIKEYVGNYLHNISRLAIKRSTVEYYLSRKMFSNDCSVRKVYDKIKNQVEYNPKDDKDTGNVTFGFDTYENMEKLVSIILTNVRKERYKLDNASGKVRDMLELLVATPGKKRKLILDKLTNYDKGRSAKIEKMIRFMNKNESEVVEEDAKEFTKDAEKNLKRDCIKSIRESIDLLEKFGLIEHYIDLSNKNYKNMYIYNYESTYDEFKKQTSESCLKNLGVNQLIMMSAFWTNRVNKIISELNKSLYIVSHKELYSVIQDENGEDRIQVDEETIKKVELKMEVLHKIYLDIFPTAEKTKSPNENNKIILDKECEELVNKSGREYKEYFDKKLKNSENSLMNDLLEVNIYENTIYNSYKIKDQNVQAIILSLLNNEKSKIKNYGYIPEGNCDVEQKEYMLIGADVPGFNMPLRLHIRKKALMDVLGGAQKGKTTLQVYNGVEDFNINNEDIFSTYMYIPLNASKKRTIKEAKRKLTNRERYGRTIKHLDYIANNDEIPEHMKANKKKYIDFKTGNIDIEEEENER